MSRCRPATRRLPCRRSRPPPPKARQIAVPLKEALLPYLARRSPEVDDIGACNTLVREAGGRMGYNTDAQGFERALWNSWRIGPARLEGHADWRGRGRQGDSPCPFPPRVRTAILNRTVSKARVLSQRYGFAYGPCTEHSTEPPTAHADIVIQATVVGMDGERQGIPWTGTISPAGSPFSTPSTVPSAASSWSARPRQVADHGRMEDAPLPIGGAVRSLDRPGTAVHLFFLR